MLIKRGAALVDTQVFGFRYSSVLTPRRNAMPGHRATTIATTATVRRRRPPSSGLAGLQARTPACGMMTCGLRRVTLSNLV